jgi:peptide/nickel transport system substrate-binding protein
MLARLVKAGKLPPVEERLPNNPVVVQPAERTGVYGGTWRAPLLGTSDVPWLRRTIGYEALTRWDPTGTKVVPSIAESFESSPDAREYTITLRRGMRWSDGAPFTADDLVFAYDEVLLNTDLMPVTRPAFVSGTKPAALTKVDDRTVRLTFDRPNATLPTMLAGTAGGDSGGLTQYPQHYMKQFHPKHSPDAEERAKDEGFDTWVEMFLAKGDPWVNKDLPRLHAWMLTGELGEGAQLRAERNPYYWKVDDRGRQLPYIDTVAFDVMTNLEAILLKATNGEFDFLTRHINTLSNKPVLGRGREDGDYDFVGMQTTFMNDMHIGLNLNHEDQTLRSIFQNKDFRIGLSHAINRQEMSVAVWQRQGTPWQAAPLEASRFYDEEMAHQYLEYDVDRANDHLDRAGLTKRDESGFRLRPDGKRLSFQVEIATPALVTFWVDGMGLVVDYWKEVGVDARIKNEDRTLFGERTAANKHDAYVWLGPGGLADEILKTYCYFPSVAVNQAWAVLWSQWFLSRGASGEEPPAAPKRQMELYWQLLEEPDEAKRDDLYRQILSIAKDEFYVIGTILTKDAYGIVRNNFHNVPEGIPDSDTFSTPALTNPEQYFIE